MTTNQFMNPVENTRHAVVIGSSVGGMAVAQVLLRHFGRVTLVERDRLPGSPQPRKGVPQGRQPHALMLRGLNALEQLFPGFRQELIEGGAVVANMGADFAFNVFGRWRQAPYASALSGLCASRPLIEFTLFRRLKDHPRLTVIQEHEAIGLLADAEGKRATGVRLRDRSAPGAAEIHLEADFVVDASGRESKAPEWLKTLGYAPPEETVVTADPGYSTRFYEAAPGHDWKMMYVMPAAPDKRRGALIMPMEGGLWQVCMIGMDGEHPPVDEAGFLDYARSLPSPRVYEAIQAAKAQGDPIGFRKGENRLRHYETLPRHLESFVAFGDAVYALNPVYGQGMSVAAAGALELDACLRGQRAWRGVGSLDGLAARFQKKLLGVLMPAWMMATGEDRRWARLEQAGRAAIAEKNPMIRLLQKYMTRVLHVQADDDVVAEGFFYVQQMLRSPFSLLHPRILFRVLRAKHGAPAGAKPASSVAPIPA